MRIFSTAEVSGDSTGKSHSAAGPVGVRSSLQTCHVIEHKCLLDDLNRQFMLG